MRSNDVFSQKIDQKLSTLEANFQAMQAFIDQKFNQLESEIENLELRVSNLR